MRRWSLKLAALASNCLLSACGSAEGEGSVSVSVWGEEYIEVGIPRGAFEDGWSVKYDEFLIALGDVSVDKADGPSGGSLDQVVLFDLTEAGPQRFGTVDGLATGNWDEFGFSSLVVTDETTRADSASADDVELMVDGGYNVYVRGTATKDDRRKQFSWGFSEPVRYASCVDVSDGQEISGVVVGDGAQVAAELTIHGDHLFYDDLVSPEAKLRFEVIASADADDDGEVTLDELAAIQLADLSSDQGPYGVGGFDVDDMRGFVAAATTSLGHFNGEGHCRPELP